MELAGKVVVITGASSGIGRETARAFAREGARLALGARREERLADLVREIEAGGGEALYRSTDVQEQEEVRALVDAAHERWGAVDVLVNNAGYGSGKPFVDMDLEEIRDQVHTNYLGAVYATKAALEHMLPRRQGQIINVCSVAAKLPIPNLATYSATKCALDGLSTALRAELGRYGIRVTAIHPSVTKTEYFDQPSVGGNQRGFARFLGQKPQTVARAIVGSAVRPRAEVYPLAVTALIPAFRAVLAPVARIALVGLARIYR